MLNKISFLNSRNYTTATLVAVSQINPLLFVPIAIIIVGTVGYRIYNPTILTSNQILFASGVSVIIQHFMNLKSDSTAIPTDFPQQLSQLSYFVDLGLTEYLILLNAIANLRGFNFELLNYITTQFPTPITPVVRLIADVILIIKNFIHFGTIPQE